MFAIYDIEYYRFDKEIWNATDSEKKSGKLSCVICVVEPRNKWQLSCKFSFGSQIRYFTIKFTHGIDFFFYVIENDLYVILGVETFVFNFGYLGID